MLLSLLFHIEKSVNQEFSIEAYNKPSLFLFDIQDEQVEGLKTFFEEHKIEVQALSPMIRGKLMRINESQYKADDEANTSFRTREEENDSRFRQRMMNLSWAESLNSSESLVSGIAFSDSIVLNPDESAVSVEKRFASRLGLKLDDRLEFDVLGVPVIGRVVNIRSVKWTSFRPNFFITFAPGALEEAPKTWLAAIGGLSQADRVSIQNKIQKLFSNISVVDITQLVERLTTLFSRLKIALEMMAYFTILVGFVVVLSMTYHQLQKREAEMMLEKTLGIAPYRVIKMLAFELLFVGLVAFGVGGLCGALLANSISVFLLEGNAVWELLQLFYLILLGLLLVMLPVGVLVPKILNTRPAGLLQRP
jgi:putative ABC transport system permease protein